LVRLLLGLLGVVLIASCGGGTDGDVPLIFAAASLSDVLTDSAEIYERETGKQVAFSFGGSITLANQIAKLGAPADGAFVVGYEPIVIISDAGLRDSERRRDLFTNNLVVIGSSGEPSIHSLSELAAFDVPVAIADPVLAPAGVYAREALGTAGIWDEISESAIFTLDVRSAMAAVTSGNARFGIVYMTDAASSDSLSIVHEIAGGHRRIEYTPIVINGSVNYNGAKDFFDFVTLDADVRLIFETAGFRFVSDTGTSKKSPRN
jgi:molybdate transport system substrate-binding protein